MWPTISTVCPNLAFVRAYIGLWLILRMPLDSDKSATHELATIDPGNNCEVTFHDDVRPAADDGRRASRPGQRKAQPTGKKPKTEKIRSS